MSSTECRYNVGHDVTKKIKKMRVPPKTALLHVRLQKSTAVKWKNMPYVRWHCKRLMVFQINPSHAKFKIADLGMNALSSGRKSL